jgi:hypothetical protein
MWKRLLTVALVGLWSAGAQAADSDPCQTSATYWQKPSASHVKPIWCVVLCDAKTADGNCTNYDLQSAGGVPDVVAFELHEVDSVTYGTTGDCTAGTVTINTAVATSGITTASENAFDIGSTTAVAIGGVNKILLDTKIAPLDRYVVAAIAGITGNCTVDSVDVLMIGYEENKE